MILPGIDPNSPIPEVLRNHTFGAGPSSGAGVVRRVLLVGNNTAAGSEADDVLSATPIENDDDARDRLGPRSEAYAMYRKFVAVPQDVDVFVLCPTESAGAQTSVELTISGTSDASSGWKIHMHGETIPVSVVSGSTATQTASLVAAAMTAADDGRLQGTFVAVIDGAGPDYKVTCTYSQNGDRGDHVIGDTISLGIRVATTGPTNAQTLVKNTGSFSAGGAADDWSVAIVEMAATDEFYYHALAKTSLIVAVATDNGLGEYMTAITAQSQPVNGKDQRVFFGQVGTPTENTTVNTSATLNSVMATAIVQEKSDWSTAMLAAHHCAIARQQEVGHPSENINGWTASDNQVYLTPPSFLKADRPTRAEQATILNNGGSPVITVGTRAVWQRFITTRSLNDEATPANDYRAREAHIPSAIFFAWAKLEQAWAGIRQPFADEDPVDDRPTAERTMTPATIVGMIEGEMDELTSSSPYGIYSGPIMRPSALDEMKRAIRVKYAGGGKFPTTIDWKVVEHTISWEVENRQVGDGY